MNSEIFYKNKIKNHRRRIITKMGNDIKKRFSLKPIRIQPINCESDTKYNKVIF